MSSVKRVVEEDLLLQLRDLEAPQVKNRFCLLFLFIICYHNSHIITDRQIYLSCGGTLHQQSYGSRSCPIRNQRYQLTLALLCLLVWVERWLGQPMPVGPLHRELLAAIAETNPSCDLATVKPQIVHMM